MAKTVPGDPNDPNGVLFELGDRKPVEALIARLPHPLWTENKAKLIERYLRLFVFVTKNGAYIDGFAGPQEEKDGSDLWSASLVLRSTPRRLRKFFLFDENPHQVKRLSALRDEQLPLREPSHRIEVIQGDFNANIGGLLDQRPIADKEATFALLDQRTFECHWSSARRIAEYKPKGEYKIEQFYFFPEGWAARSIAALKNDDILRNWWGRDDIDKLRNAESSNLINLFVDRFKTELNYTYVMPWPIWERPNAGGRVMYRMIHATDHPEAPKLMNRAYRQAIDPNEPEEQLELELAGLGSAST